MSNTNQVAEDTTMTSQTYKTMTDADLELVNGGRTAPAAGARDGDIDGNVALNEGPSNVGDPQSVF